jgi:acetyl esterase/lipase
MLAVALTLVMASLGVWSAPAGAAPVRYLDEVFTSVKALEDVPYGAVLQDGRSVTLRLDLYAPAGDKTSTRPLIIWVHGGGFSKGDKASPQTVDLATAFARRGFVAASINYRLSSGGCDAGLELDSGCTEAITDARADALDAVAFLRKNAATYGIDPDRIAIGGTSAGAITAVNVAFSSNGNPTSGVTAAVSISGAEAIAGADQGDAPVLLFNGTDDPVVPYRLAQATVADAGAADVPAVLVSYTGEGHLIYETHRTAIQERAGTFLFNRLDLGAM